MMFARTLVPPQSMTAATKGTSTPGAAKVMIENDRTTPSVGMSTDVKSVAKHEAHALRRSK
jgi:hypothetical protein